VRVASGANEGQRTTTETTGRYAISNLEPGAMTIEVSAAAHLAKVVGFTLDADRSESVTLVAAVSTPGRAVDVLTQVGVAAVSIAGDGVVPSSTNGDGGFLLIAPSGAGDRQLVRFSGSTVVERSTTIRVPGPTTTVSLIPGGFDLAAFDQMLRAPSLGRWTSPPPLVVVTRVLEFTDLLMAEASALAAVVTDADHDGLAADFAWALPQMTGGAFGQFAGVSRRSANTGDRVGLLNAGVITVARVDGLFEKTGFQGYGRWLALSDRTVVGGLVMLDRDFDEGVGPLRRGLRAHELGHALGYNHLTTRPSVMSPTAPVSPTAFDLEAFRIAFQRPPGNRSPDVDPADHSINRAGGPARWSPAIR
jgi:hypothetical protein